MGVSAAAVCRSLFVVRRLFVRSSFVRSFVRRSSLLRAHTHWSLKSDSGSKVE